MKPSRRLILAGGLALLPGLAQAQAASATAVDPLAVLRQIYKGPEARKAEPFSKRLDGLFKAAQRRSKQLNEPVEGLDFEYSINGQDHEDGTYKSVRIALVSQAENRATARVTFRNGAPQELRYDLVRENGRWLIDDVTSVTEPRWTLSQMYRRGAATPRS